MKKVQLKNKNLTNTIASEQSDNAVIKVVSKKSNLLSTDSKDRITRELKQVTEKCNSIIALVSQRNIRSKEFGNQQQFHDQVKSIMKTLISIHKITLQSSVEPKVKSKKELFIGPKEEGK
jgi:hypothetical protein